MRKFTLPPTAILAATLALSLQATPAQALLDKTWVASGGGAGTCSRTAPCATFQQAHDGANAGGQINCVDAADYGPVTISKSISIVCDNTQAGIKVTSGAAITIAGVATDVVTLKGLDLDGSSGASDGINIVTVGTVHVHKLQIRRFTSNGIDIQTNNYTELYVADSYITDNGIGSGAGIAGNQGGAGSANISVNRVRLENNFIGIVLRGDASTGVAVNATIRDSVVAGSASNGIQALTIAGKAAVSILVDHSVFSGNFGSGITADGATASGAGSALVRISDSTIVLNNIGVSATGAGVLQSFKNNRISGNLTDGTPIPAFVGPGGTALQ